MVEEYFPDTARLLAQQASRRRWMMGLMIFFVLLVSGIIAALNVWVPKVSLGGSIAAGAVVVVIAAIPVIVWNCPRMGVYLLVVGAIVLGGTIGGTTPFVPTTYVPFWWNLSTVFRSYVSPGLADSVPVSPAELIMILTTIVWIVRGAVTRTFEFRTGSFFWPIVIYTAAFGLGGIHGWATGGKMVYVLWEIRPQFQFLLVFVLACNLITKREHVKQLLWLIAGSIALMSVFYSASWSTGDRTDFGIRGMDHGDSMAMCFALFVCFIGAILAYDKRLTWMTALFLPTTLLALLGNNRRAGIAAFVIAFIPLVPLLWVAFKDRRLQVARFAIFFVVASVIYLPIAWNAKGMWAFPAQALRSNSDPSARDAASNNYRLAEDADLKMTRDLKPWTGIGFGKEFARFVPLPYIGDVDLLKYLPHNSILWVWMRIGHIGFLIFFMMLASCLIQGTQSVLATKDKTLRMFGVLAMMQLLMHYVYGKYDLQWASPRMMCFTGILLAVLCMIRRIEQEDPPPAESAAAV